MRLIGSPSMASRDPSFESRAPEVAALEAVHRLRLALRRGDSATVADVRAAVPRRPHERDLLTDLIDADGLEPAVRRLSRFWSHARVELELVRVVDADEVEVYERAVLPHEQLSIVSLVRREAGSRTYRVVCTLEARDERFEAWIVGRGDPLDDVAWSRSFAGRFGADAELVMNGDEGVLGHPRAGFLAELSAPEECRRWPEALPGEGSPIRRLKFSLALEAERRRQQLEWALRALDVLADADGASAVYVPAHDKVLPVPGLRRATRDARSPEQRSRLWVAVRLVQGHWVTSGLSLFGLPELELEAGALGSGARPLLRSLAASLVRARTLPWRDVLVEQDGMTFSVAPGRRGPRPGRSYGRWGAVRLVPDAGERGSDRPRRSSGLRWSPVPSP